MKKGKVMALGIGGLIVVALLPLIIAFLSFPFGYVVRCLKWLPEATITDYRRLAAREVDNAPPRFDFKIHLSESLPSAFSDIEYKSQGRMKNVGDLDTFLESTDSTAFIVIQDDTILYEQYFNGYERDSINTSFSVAKSFDSTLIGIAIDEGYIESIDEPITNYIPELTTKEGMESITIKNLISMSSGLRYRDTLPLFLAFWSDGPKTYLYPDLRDIALTVRVEEPPGEYFHYNNYNPLLEGIILERATGQSVSHYLQEKIWKPLGMEFPASWSLDSEGGFEKMESGINARAIDFAKFGRLFLNKGMWNGKRIVSEEWVLEATSPMPVEDYDKYYIEACRKHDRGMEGYFVSGIGYYKYHWWGYTRENGGYDYSAEGARGQSIHISPSKNAIIVRNGKSYGDVDIWEEVLFEMANRLQPSKI